LTAALVDEQSKLTREITQNRMTTIERSWMGWGSRRDDMLKLLESNIELDSFRDVQKASFHGHGYEHTFRMVVSRTFQEAVAIKKVRNNTQDPVLGRWCLRSIIMSFRHTCNAVMV
jgi:hypothetical protein